MEKFAAHSVRKLPLGSGGGTASGTATTGGATGGATGTQTQGSGSTGSATGSASGTNPGKGTTTRSRPVKDRKNLADRGLAISNGPLNQFYSELKSLSVETKPHISAAIIRVFVEKATTVYLEALKIPPLNKQPNATWHDYGIKLHSKVDAALTHLDPAGNNPDLRNARDIANGNRDKSHTLDHLNVAIHDHRALPAPSEIITIWDRYHPYFVALFAAIEAAKPKK